MRVKFCAQNQPLNVNIDKVMMTLRPDLGPAKKRGDLGVLGPPRLTCFMASEQGFQAGKIETPQMDFFLGEG